MFQRIIAAALLSALSLQAAAKEPFFPAGQQGVGFSTVKGVFWLANATVEGRNLTVSAKLAQGGDKKNPTHQLIMTIASDGFVTGNGSRDKTVKLLLGGDAKTPLTFASRELKPGELKDLLGGTLDHVEGTLTIMGQGHPVDFKTTPREGGLDGYFQTTFSEMGVKVPVVGGGMIAIPKDKVTLLVRLVGSQVEGAGEFAALLPAAAATPAKAEESPAKK